MAKPDCDDGWHKIAYELEAAICFANFTKPALTLLRCGFAQIYGKGDRPAVMRLPQAAIASLVGQDRQTIYRAVEELVGSGVLIRVDDDRYRFVKDYESWKTWGRNPASRGKARLSPAEVACCKDSPDYARSFEASPGAPEAGSMDVSRPAYTHTEVDGPASAIRTTPRRPSGLQVVVHPADKTSPPYVPPIRKEIESKREDDDAGRAGEEGDSGKLSLPDLVAWLPCIAGNPGELEQLARVVPLWSDWISRRCPQHAGSACEWIQDALLSSSEADDVALYARKILKGYVGAGGRPDFELAPRPRAVPDETDVVAAPANGAHRAAKLSYADRVRADRERLLASFDNPSEPEARP